jgi:hypothetical protein
VTATVIQYHDGFRRQAKGKKPSSKLKSGQFRPKEGVGRHMVSREAWEA